MDITMAKKLTQEEFLERVKKIHGDKYNYDKAEYTGANNKVIIGCPIHGDFRQSACAHLAGSGCNSCGNRTTKNKLSMGYDEFINRCKDKHNNYYDYSMVDSNNFSLKKRIEIICPKHGQYSLVAVNHMNGSKCRRCTLDSPLTDKQKKYREKLKTGEHSRLGSDEWVKRIKLNENDNLTIDIQPDAVLTGRSIITYTCNKHPQLGKKNITINEFVTHKFNCKYCSAEHVSKVNSPGLENFIKKATSVHGGYYDYSAITEYKNGRNKVEIICPIHGSFFQCAANHINNKHGCPKCYREFRQAAIFYSVSSQEIKLQKWLTSNNILFEASNRNKIFPLELDLFLPDYNLAIEVNGVYWHSTEFKDEHYHINKLNECIKNNITLLQFYDTEIDNDWGFVTGLINDYLCSSVVLPDDELINRRFYPMLDAEVLKPTIDNIKGCDVWNSGWYKLKQKSSIQTRNDIL